MIWSLIPHPMALGAASPVADRRIRSGYKRLEEEVVVQLTKDGGMSENPPISYILVCGHVSAVGGVGGPESQRRDSKAILGSISTSNVNEALEGRV